MELPNKTYIYLSTRVKYLESPNNINLFLINSSLTFAMIQLLKSKNKSSYRISYSGSLKTFNELLEALSIYRFSGNVTIIPTIKILKNNYLALEDLPDNVKIEIPSSLSNIPNPLIEWCLNLADEDFERIFFKINNPEQRNHLKKEREIAKTVYMHLSQNVDFSKMTPTEKMNFMYRWVRKNIGYDISLVNSTGFKDDVDKSLGIDPVKVFFRQKGVCSGRSRLLRILTNNPYLNLQCFTVTGTVNCGNVKKHEWNVFIDENNQVYYYDTSFGEIEHIKDLNSSDKKYNIETQHFLVSDILNKQCPHPLPRRRIPPLPPRKKKQE